MVAPVPVPSWQGPINRLLYGLMFERTVDASTVEAATTGLIQGQLKGDDPEETYTAIGAALASGAQLTAALSTEHSEDTFRAFLGHLRDRLDQLRPWPQPPYRKLGIAAWNSFGTGTPIASIPATPLALQEHLHVFFDNPTPGGTE